MYNVSNAYKEAVKGNVIRYSLSGTIGSVPFTEQNIVEGSFSISNQCTQTNNLMLGSCFIGTLQAEFTWGNDPEPIVYDKWTNKKITPSLIVDIGNNQTETIPLGIFKIKEAKHTAEGVKVIAYDNMIKLDKKFKKSHFTTKKTMWEFISTVCTDCHITCANTESEINSMVTGTAQYEVYGATGKKSEFANDIDTYRDITFWIAQAMGCFATIDRAGQLVFKNFTRGVADEIADTNRLAGAEFESFITSFTGVYFEDLDSGDDHYYGYDVTALQAEVAQLTVQKGNLQTDLQDLEDDYQHGRIDEQTYLAQKKVLTTQIKQITKRINKLNDLIEELQNDDDQNGTDMDCGGNPFLQDANETTRNTQRMNVLNALEGAQYTPFTSSVVVGAHYDLGDVLYFISGHAGEGQYCCIMSYEFTYNGAYYMEGYGSEDAKNVIKTKEAKKAKQATNDAAVSKKIAESKPDITVSGNPPSGGKTGDVHVQTGTATHTAPKYELVWEERWVNQPWNPQHNNFIIRDDCLRPTSLAWNESTNGYDFVVQGSCYWQMATSNSSYYQNNGTPIITVKNIEPGTYKWSAHIVYHVDGVHETHAMGAESMGLTLYDDRANPESTDCGNPGDWAPAGAPYQDNVGMTVGFKLSYNQDVVQTYMDTFTIPQSWISQRGTINLSFPRMRAMCNKDDGATDYHNITNYLTLTVTNFKLEKVIDPQTGETDGGYTETQEPYVGQVSVKDPSGNWQTIQRIADIETPSDPAKQEETGLQVTQDTRILSLRKNVMRSAVKSGPPGKDNKPNYSQFRVRYTGKPDSDAKIIFHSGHGWSSANSRIKHDDNNVYKFSASGTNVSGDVNYCAFKITNLTKNKKYHFNFAAKWNDGTTFGKDYTKGCGVVFNDTGVINTNDWTGNPDTFNENTGYCSFMRNTSKRYYECDFMATASTMYMVLTTADITNTDEHSITFYDFVIGRTARSYMRELYMYDYVTDTWMKYMPFSAVTGGGEEPSGEGSVVTVTPVDPATLNNPIKIADMTVDGDEYAIYAPNGSVINSLDDIGDVEIINPTTGQVLKYNATTQKWENSADTGGADAVEITWAAYQALPTSQKEDPTKVYYITDYPSGGGGGGGGGASITYGYDNPSGSATDGSLYILLSSINDKKQGEFLYMTNQWVLIDGYPYVNETKLYDNGTEEIAWEVPSGSGSKNSDNISLVVGAGNYSHYAITSNPVNVTDFNTLSIQCRYRGQDYNEDLDISSYTGYKYISFTYLTDDNHNEIAVGLSDTKTSAATIRIDSRNGGTAEAKLYYMSLKVV